MNVLYVILACVLIIIVGGVIRAYAMYMERKRIEKDQKELVRKYKEKMSRGNVNRWGEYL
jgi:hypothetical protein